MRTRATCPCDWQGTHVALVRILVVLVILLGLNLAVLLRLLGR
jgi:hypothetical protein